MAQRKLINFRFPLKGLDRTGAYQDQPPFSSPDQQNVRGFSSPEGRATGGQRPGLTKGYDEQLHGPVGEIGPITTIRMLGQVTAVQTDTDLYTFYDADEFDRDGVTLGVGWTQPSWIADFAPTKKVIGDPLTYKSPSGGIRKALFFNAAQPYTVSIRISPWLAKHWGRYYLYARMDNVGPDVQDEGVEVELLLGPGTGVYSGWLRSNWGGSHWVWPLSGGTLPADTAGWLRLEINGNNVSVFWRNIKLIGPIAVHAHTGKRTGFSMDTTGTWSQGLCLVDVFRVNGAPTGCETGFNRRTFLVAEAGGNIWAERDIGEMAQVTGDTAHVHSGHLTQCSERLQKLYIADFGVRCLCKDDGTLAVDPVSLKSRLTATSITDWEVYGIDAATDLVVITNGLPTVVDGTYAINDVDTGYVELTVDAGDGGCSYRIERAPKIYDPKAAVGSQVTIWTAPPAKGAVPIGCTLICTYRDRLVLAGWPAHQFFMCRQGDPHDWDYSQADDKAAVSGQTAEAGELGDIFTAVIPFRDRFLTFGCKGSLWLVRGDPKTGGEIEAVSRTVGIVDRGAWCQGSFGEIYFLSSDGVYRLAPGATAIEAMSSEVLSRLSGNVLPRELQNIDTLQYECLLGWDEAAHGVHIYLTPRFPGQGVDVEHWFFDVRLQAFNRDTLVEDHCPLAVLNYQTEIAAYKTFIIGSQDGYLRRYNVSTHDDDGEPITSYVLYQPVNMQDGDWQGKLIELVGTLPVPFAGAGPPGSVAWELYVGNSHEEAVKAAVPSDSGTWTGAGMHASARPTARGSSLVLKLLNGNGLAWGIETVRGVVAPAGRSRVYGGAGVWPLPTTTTTTTAAPTTTTTTPAPTTTTTTPAPTTTSTTPEPTTTTTTPAPTTTTTTPAPTTTSTTPEPTTTTTTPAPTTTTTTPEPTTTTTTAAPLDCCCACYCTTAGQGTISIACSVQAGTGCVPAGCSTKTGNCTYNETADKCTIAAGLNKKANTGCSGGTGIYGYAYTYASNDCA